MLVIQGKTHLESLDRLVKAAFIGIGSPKAVPYFRIILGFSNTHSFESIDDFVILFERNESFHVFDKYLITCGESVESLLQDCQCPLYITCLLIDGSKVLIRHINIFSL